MRKNRVRWLRSQADPGRDAPRRHLGWPNTYTFTKSLGESLLATRGAGLPIAIVRPSIVETSTHQPFRGWNEGINTSAPLSYLLGTYFPATALEQPQVPGHDSGGYGVPRNDADRRGARSSGGTSRSINWRLRQAIRATWGARSS